jgi:hypothetical protein
VETPIASDVVFHSTPPAHVFDGQVERGPAKLQTDRQDHDTSSVRERSAQATQSSIGAPQDEQPRFLYDFQSDTRHELASREPARTPSAPTNTHISPSHQVPSEVRESLPEIRPVSATPSESTQKMPATLQGVLSEIARRQEALEVRYQADQVAERKATPASTMASDAQRDQREDEQVLVSIGSIVVQMEAETPASSPPLSRPTLRRPPREVRNNWARSFLDR